MIQSNRYYTGKDGHGKKTQGWEIGQVVNIGFLKGLTVLSVQAVKDGLPDIYTLQAVNGSKYEFIPHNGLHRIN